MIVARTVTGFREPDGLPFFDERLAGFELLAATRKESPLEARASLYSNLQVLAKGKGRGKCRH